MKTRGYSLLEVLAAGAILAIAAAAAAALALITVSQEEVNARILRCTNLHEQAGRLYQLGLDPSTVTALLPPDPAVVSLTFANAAIAISGVGTVEQATTTFVFTTTPLGIDWSADTWSGGENSDTARRTQNFVFVRPVLR